MTMSIPIHAHQDVPVAASPGDVCRRLHADGHTLVVSATAAALTAGEPLREAGGFRSRALPIVDTRPPDDDEVGCLVVRWGGDEDATGWPSLDLWVVPSPTPDGGSRLLLLSPRHPGVDLSTNRVDKQWRERLARTAVRSFATALAGLLEGDAATVERSHRPLRIASGARP